MAREVILTDKSSEPNIPNDHYLRGIPCSFSLEQEKRFTFLPSVWITVETGFLSIAAPVYRIFCQVRVPFICYLTENG